MKLCMVPENETVEWAKNNRLQALKQLIPFTTDSNEEMSPVASDGLVSSESSRNFHSCKSISLKENPVSETKYESGKHESKKKMVKIIQDFLLPALDAAKYGEHLFWINRRKRIFYIYWGRKNSGEMAKRRCSSFYGLSFNSKKKLN